jgi:hypothetical protein
VRRRLAATPLAMPDARTLRLSCSTGAAEWQANQGIGDLLGQAAEALRNARGTLAPEAQRRGEGRLTPQQRP